LADVRGDGADVCRHQVLKLGVGKGGVEQRQRLPVFLRQARYLAAMSAQST